MKKSLIQTIAAIIAVLVIVGIVWGLIYKPKSKLGSAASIDTTGQPTLGKADAKVQLVVFEDLKCIACKRFNNTVFPKIKEQYIDSGIANYTVINLAFIPGSMPAANAARCLYKENPTWFFNFVDYVYQNQPPEQEDWATIPRLMEFASHIPGIDQEKLSHCLFESPYTEFIENNFKMAGKLQGNTISTPAIYVNGRQIDPPSLEKLQAAIKAAE